MFFMNHLRFAAMAASGVVGQWTVDPSNLLINPARGSSVGLPADTDPVQVTRNLDGAFRRTT